MRLDKFITACGAASRRDTKRLVKAGMITVNGVPAAKADMSINENIDKIALNGRELCYREFVYLMLNKPSGYVSATEDKHYPAVTELVPEEYAHFGVFPIGRLDIDTEGLLLLTNDGAFSHELTSPKKRVYKKYFARLDRPAEEKDKELFRNGMDLGDFVTKPAILEICKNPKEVYVHICEGKFHQVKRMCEKCGKTVEYLMRVSIGRLELDGELEKGAVRELSSEELAAVKINSLKTEKL